MFIAVQHTIRDPKKFWEGASQVLSNIPKGSSLHQSFSAPDGKRAICIWESESVDTLRKFLEPMIREISQNDYFAIGNKEGVVMPNLQKLAGAA
jgi:hypothetical protein